MANVRLLRQSLEDYNNRVAKLDSQYQADYAKYRADVEGFNADVTAHPFNQAASDSVGRAQYLMGYTPVVEETTEAGKRYIVSGGEPIYGDSPTSRSTPVAPAAVVPPRAPNLTSNDARAMANPGTDPAGVVRANNVGYTGNSEIAALNSGAMRNSAFADPADPQNLKERGILARVMGGQL